MSITDGENGKKIRLACETRRARMSTDGTDLITTRTPAPLVAYTRSIADLQFGTLRRMYFFMVKQFLDERPWTKGLRWRHAKSLIDRSEINPVATGWVQVNLRLPTPIVHQVLDESALHQISPTTFLYTAFYWWTWYKYPPRDEVERRRRKAIGQEE